MNRQDNMLANLICGGFFLFVISGAAGAPVYEDAFVEDPEAGGWTEDADGGSITHNGSDAVFAGQGGSVQKVTRTISTAGRTGMYVHFTASANADSEWNDFFRFQVDSDGDGTFESVASANADHPSFQNLDPMPLPTAAEDNSSLPIRMTWEHNDTGEDGYLDHLTIFEAPDEIATDPFDLDPAANGWTEGGGSVTSNGSGQASLQGTPTSWIQKEFDFSEYANILVNLEGINDGYNDRGDDHIIMEVDTGGGFAEIARQTDGDPYLLGALLPAEADGNSSVLLRLKADSSAAGQDTLFDQLTISGLAIPEPASFALLAFGAAAALLRRRAC